MKDKLINLIKEEADKKELKLDGIEFGSRYAYDFNSNIIYLNENIDNSLLNQEIEEYKNNKNLYIVEDRKEIIIDDEFKEKLIMFMALHELRHAEQNKMLNETFKNYDKTQIKYLLISLLKSTPFIKMMYHDKLYYEFDANMDASMYFKDDEVMKRYLAYKFLVSYTNKPGKEIIEPIKNNMTTFGNSLNGFTHFEVGKYLNGHNDEITDSMQLGFTVKNEEINKIIKLYRG